MILYTYFFRTKMEASDDHFAPQGIGTDQQVRLQVVVVALLHPVHDLRLRTCLRPHLRLLGYLSTRR